MSTGHLGFVIIKKMNQCNSRLFTLVKRRLKTYSKLWLPL